MKEYGDPHWDREDPEDEEDQGDRYHGEDDHEKGDILEVKTKYGLHEWYFTGYGTCRDCGEEILWAETQNGKNAPVDREPDDYAIYSCHFDSCPVRSEKWNKRAQEDQSRSPSRRKR